MGMIKKTEVFKMRRIPVLVEGEHVAGSVTEKQRCWRLHLQRPITQLTLGRRGGHTYKHL